MSDFWDINGGVNASDEKYRCKLQLYLQLKYYILEYAKIYCDGIAWLLRFSS